MVKRLLYIILVLSANVCAQSGTNKWIDYSKAYYKFPVTASGVYKITYSALASANLISANPQKVKVFGRGEEQYIHFEGEDDGIIDPNDFILVYAERNDSYFDQQMYEDSTHSPNPYYSLYNDTIYYFISVGSTNSTKRYNIDTDLNFNGYTSSKFFKYTDYKYYHSQYSAGIVTTLKTYYPKYTKSEGWIGGTIYKNDAFIDSIASNYYNPLGGTASVEAAITGLTNDPNVDPDHNVKFYYNNILLADTAYESHGTLHFKYDIPSNQWGNTSVLKFTVPGGTPQTYDRSAVGFIKVSYPRAFNLSNLTSAKMEVYNGTNKAYLEITGFNNQNTETYLLDLTNHLKIPVLKSGGFHKALVPNTVANAKNCFITSDAACIKVNYLEPAVHGSNRFTDFKTESSSNSIYDYYILSVKEFANETQAYKTYRNSTGYNTTVADMEELYMQYADGIRKHPLAIRNFAKDMVKNWNLPVAKYFFLIGKSIQPGHPDNDVNARSISNSSRQNAANYANNKVPTFGYPGSDSYLTSLITDTSHYEPEIPIGRISATNGAKITEYLNKVKEFESNTEAFWMKRVLHFGGGKDKLEGNLFAFYLNSFKATIEDTLYGGKVNTYLKNTTDPLQMNLSDSIRSNINDGSSLMTFFGHAYGTGFDQNIDAPSAYNNKGKYPLILANSCLIGNIHLPDDNSGSEVWVFEPNKGAIGFLASVSLGEAGNLYLYSGNFYKNLATRHYGEGLGDVLRHTVLDVQATDENNNYSNPYVQDVCMLMTLHADPALRLNTHAKPDYTIYGPNGLSQQMIKINPVEVSTQDEKFTITATVSNIGKAIRDSIDIRLTRKFPTGIQDSIYIIRIAGVRFQSDVTFTLPVDLINGVGLNTFVIDVDCYYKVSELDDLVNNTCTFQMNIKSADVVPIYPYQYAIVPTKISALKASTSDPLSGTRKYVFQIDTCKNFNSPSLYTTSITNSGGVIELDPIEDAGLYSFYNNFPTVTTLASPTVFFWRVSLDSSYTHAFNWKNSSFQYVQNKSGWGQAHFQQWEENSYNFLRANASTRKFSFSEHVRELYVQTSGYGGSTERVDNLWRVDGSLKGYWKWPYTGDVRSTTHLLQVAVIDHASLNPWRVDDKPDYGQVNEPGNQYLNAVPYGEVTYWFQTGVSDVAPKGGYFKGINNLLAAAKDSDYIALYTYRSSNFNELFTNRGSDGTTFKNNLLALGANTDSLSKFATAGQAFPYILIAQKGNPSFATQTWGTSEWNVISLAADMKNNGQSGSASSKLIGPAKNWNAFYWESTPLEGGNVHDTLNVKVYGVDANKNEVLLHTFNGANGSTLQFDTIANAATYPYLRLESYLSDDSLHTPNQLKRWQIVFDEITELALNPNVKYSITSDSLQEGNTMKIIIAVTNVSKTNSDSIQVVHWFINNNTIKGVTYRMLPPLAAGESYYDTISINTLNTNGANRLWYEINPYTGPQAWQLEQHHFNNILDLPFDVFPDRQNPLLDVAFDGIHILNGDIVSPKAWVSIQLKDENQFLALDKGSLFTIIVNKLTPTGLIDSTFIIDEDDYTFYPAVLPDNKCRLEFQGNFAEEGKYELRVKALDRSANKSGAGDGTAEYRIQFEVVLKSSITEVLNWPNPFTTSTQFVFTLTGSELPSDFRIDIMNITGKIVKEITLQDIGSINIGRNISEYKWDGTDNFGDPLGNGVYLYRVTAKINGEDIESREVSISTTSGPSTLEKQYFKHGWGKLYIMR